MAMEATHVQASRVTEGATAPVTGCRHRRWDWLRGKRSKATLDVVNLRFL